MSIFIERKDEIIKHIKEYKLYLKSSDDFYFIGCGDRWNTEDNPCLNCPLYYISECTDGILTEEEELLYKLEISEEFI